jgi:hypothetical protein
MNKDRYVSVRVNEEFSEELEKVLGQMDDGFGCSSTRSWKIRWLLRLGLNSVRSNDLIFGGNSE